VLREALKDGAEILEELLDGPYYKAGWEALAKMKAALASSPAHSVRRWEKMRDVVEAARILSEFRPNTGFLKGEAIELNSALIEIRSALAALDNDDGEGKL
jgi:hypothetical protein